MKNKTKKISDEQGKKQVEALKVLRPEKNKEEEIKSVEGLFSKGMVPKEIKNVIDRIKIFEDKIRQKDLLYEPNKCKCDF